MTNIKSLSEVKLKPDHEVILEMEKALDMAKSGELRSFGLVGRKADGNAYSAFQTDDIFLLVAMLELLKLDLFRSAKALPEMGDL